MGKAKKADEAGSALDGVDGVLFNGDAGLHAEVFEGLLQPVEVVLKAVAAHVGERSEAHV